MERFTKALRSVKNAFTSKDKGAQPIRMLLIGETGSGKTSFLNLMCNANVVYELGLESAIEKFRAFNDLSIENAEERKMESKTSGANYYEVKFDGADVTIGIIDTPGFGDTRGLEEDKKNIKKIIDTVNGAQYIHCICLVINSRLSRMSANLRYVLSEVSGVLPKATINNLVVVLTNAKDELDSNFKVEELTPFLGKQIPEERVFYIENPYCKWEKVQQRAMENSGKITISCQLANNLRTGFKDAADMLASMFELIKEFEEVHTDSFTKLYVLKQEIERNALALVIESDNVTKTEEAYAKKKKSLVESKESNEKELNVSCTIETWVQVPTKNHNTLCSHRGCYSNCHISCGLTKTLDKANLLQCACMRGNTCRVCGHSYLDHFHTEALFERRENDSMKKYKEAIYTAEQLLAALDTEATKAKEEAEKKMAHLSAMLLTKMSEFEGLSTASSYVKCVENQLYVIDQRIEALQDDNGGSNCTGNELRRTKEELEKTVQLMKRAKALPWSDTAPKEAQLQWARGFLQVDCSATEEDIEKAYKTMAMSKHPDKGGSEEEFKMLGRAYEILH